MGGDGTQRCQLTTLSHQNGAEWQTGLMAADTSPAFALDGRIAVVIGGTGVLCGRMAAALADAGATTVIVGRDVPKGEAAVEALQAEGPDRTVEFVACDVAERSDIAELASTCLLYTSPSPRDS